MTETPETVLRAIRAVTDDFRNEMTRHGPFAAMYASESPIEAAMQVCLQYLEPSHPPLKVQQQIDIAGYRVDFLLSFEGVDLIVECDGHDYHERTKQQAAHDRSRDRRLVELGYHVMRFTGSEIYRDALGCARQAVSFVETRGIEAFWARNAQQQQTEP